ncbi:hypothetical protein N657DRAFT_143568 [Parathielavia appendiculata]|uniref:Uncharacterized protein n=1 Tax=Parathielavia appendiculata TaxID=2587402 RepID=A0AAN6TU85_9PEZI|nr:hypothetical protein N657DRAFT_143568 [Parathielavia appendiculata]
MKLPWLLPALLGSGAAAGLDKVGIAVGDKVWTVESRVYLGKGITYQEQDSEDGASIQSASANSIPAALDTLNMDLPNKTKPGLNYPDTGDAAPIITLKSASNNAAQSPEDGPSSQQAGPSSGLSHDPSGLDESSTRPSRRAETKNPASANRAIAGMGVGLVSVMLIFTVFL